ncbi:MAG: PAS domain S-box protein [Chloroflexi bacterium]|nr:PAS domain S-box protein [Chloroflexota bacterium]
MENTVYILHLEDHAADAELVQAMLELAEMSCQITLVQTQDKFIQTLSEHRYDVILADYLLPSFDGMSALRLARESYPDIPFIFVSGVLGEDAAIEALTEGATDYVLKQKLSRLAPAVKRALHEAESRRENKRAEEALRESENKWRSLVTTIPDYVALHDSDNNYVFLNHYAEGFSEQDVIGKSYLAFIPADFQPLVKEAFEKARTTGKPEFIEYAALGNQGILRHYDSYIAPLFDGSKLANTLVVARDITERKRAQEKIAHLAAIVESSNDIIISKTLDGIITSWNKGAEGVYGYTESEMIGKPISIVAPPQHANEMIQILEKIRSGSRIDHFETVRQRKDGQCIDVSLTISPIKNAEGKIVAVSTIGRDITEGKRAERALKNSEAKWRALVENAPAVITTLDREGIILSINRTSLGQTMEQVIGTRVYDNLSPREQARTREIIALVTQTGESLRYESKIVREDRTTVWHETSAGPLEEDGKIVGVIFVSLDITALKQNERALQQSNDELAFLNLASQTLNSTLDLDQVLTEMLEKVSQLLNASASSIWIADLTGDSLVCQQATGANATGVLGFRLARGVGIAGWVAQHGTSIMIPDTHKDERYVELFSQKFGMDFRSILCVPLEGKQGIVGVLEILDTAINRFQASDLVLVETLAGAATSAIENARLYEQVQKDLAERRRIEQALSESERRYRLLADNSTDVIWAHDMQMHLSYVSPSVTRLLGYTPSELQSMEFTSLFPLDSVKQAKDQYAAMRADPIAISHSTVAELEMKRKDGSPVWTETQLSFLFDETNKPSGILGITRDISERKRAEAERESQRRARELATLYETTRDLGAFLNMPILLETILQRAMKLLAVSSGAIYLYDSTRNEFLPSAEKGASIALGDSISDAWLTMRQPSLLAENQQVVHVPLTYGDELLGVLILDDLQPGDPQVDNAGLNLLSLFAGQAASAIHKILMFEHIRASRESTQALAHQLLNAQETERRSIAHELHDEIGQALTSVQLNLQNIEPIVEQSDAQDTLEDTMHVIERVLEQVRDLSRTLRPSMLDDFGLVTALRWYIERQAKRAGLHAEFAADAFEPRLPEVVETVCFRVAQEAITNVVRHAHADHIYVELRLQNGMLDLNIRDNGSGFDLPHAIQSATNGMSIGLLGMKERAALIGGQVQIIASPGQGTQIRARIPVATTAEFIERRKHKRGTN